MTLQILKGVKQKMPRRIKEIQIINPTYDQYQIINKPIALLALEELSYEEFKFFMIFLLKDEVSLAELEHQYNQWGNPEDSLYNIINRLILKNYLKENEDGTISINYDKGKDYNFIPKQDINNKEENA